jgi:hypothetical protein
MCEILYVVPCCRPNGLVINSSALKTREEILPAGTHQRLNYKTKDYREEHVRLNYMYELNYYEKKVILRMTNCANLYETDT